MAFNYSALVTAWNNASQTTGATLPAGVTGTLLTGLSTTNKLAAINAWTIAGPAMTAIIPVRQVIAAIAEADYMTLTALQLQQLQFLMQSGENVYAPVGGTVRLVFATIFAGKTTTLNALTALVNQYDAPQNLWVIAPNGLAFGGLLSTTDLALAGGLT